LAVSDIMKNCKLPEVSTPVELDRLSLPFNVCRPRLIYGIIWSMVETEKDFLFVRGGGL